VVVARGGPARDDGSTPFLRQFKASTGATPFAFLTELRMQHAATLLGRHGRSVQAVARACGYRSVSRFAAAFRRQHGVSPARYREQR
jgi:AraC family transcriptional regulator